MPRDSEVETTTDVANAVLISNDKEPPNKDARKSLTEKEKADAFNSVLPGMPVSVLFKPRGPSVNV